MLYTYVIKSLVYVPRTVIYVFLWKYITVLYPHLSREVIIHRTAQLLKHKLVWCRLNISSPHMSYMVCISSRLISTMRGFILFFFIIVVTPFPERFVIYGSRHCNISGRSPFSNQYSIRYEHVSAYDIAYVVGFIYIATILAWFVVVAVWHVVDDIVQERCTLIVSHKYFRHTPVYVFNHEHTVMLKHGPYVYVHFIPGKNKQTS